MCVIPELTRRRFLMQLESAAAVYLSPSHRYELTPTQLAELRDVARSTIYRQAHCFQTQLHSLALQPSIGTQLSIENQALQARVAQLEIQLSSAPLGHWVQVTPEKLALTALELVARHHSVSDIQAALQVAFDLPKPPSDGTIANIIKQGAALAEAILESVDYHFPLDAIEFDELFHANSPILAALEPYSMSLVLLHQLGDCKTATWSFCFEYLGTSLPPLMVHDCSQQGRSLSRKMGKKSQLCVWHRLRELGRECKPALESVYKEALKELDEERWLSAQQLEDHFATLPQLTHSLDSYRLCVRRFSSGCQELLDWCAECRRQLDALGLSCKALDGLSFRVKDYLAHLRQWEHLAQDVVFFDESGDIDGFALLDSLAEVHLREQRLRSAYETHGESENYRGEERFFLEACERLRKAQNLVANAGAIERKFRLLVDNQVRTSSRVEALNRRLRGFTEAKRRVTERQLRLMQLHHNTTRFSADAKRAGKSPWEWLELEVAGLEGGFVGVLREASRRAGVVWPSVWAVKP